MKHAVFIERDGILNQVRIQNRQQFSPRCVEEFLIKDEAVEPLRALKAAGFLLIVTTTQPGLSRGYLARRELDRMHQLLGAAFPVDEILTCPHDEMDRCPCRKPKPGLITESGFKWHLDLDRCYVISDKWQDAEAARASGCLSLLVRSPWNGPVHHYLVLPDLSGVVRKIIHLHALSQALVH